MILSTNTGRISKLSLIVLIDGLKKEEINLLTLIVTKDLAHSTITIEFLYFTNKEKSFGKNIYMETLEKKIVMMKSKIPLLNIQKLNGKV